MFKIPIIGEKVYKFRRYDLTIRKLIDVIIKMTPDERGLLLNEAVQIKTKLRATRRNCCVAILLYYAEKVYSATITNLSFTGAFVECFTAVKIGELVTVGFKDLDSSVNIKLDARIIHATEWGIGIRFKSVNSKAARFLQQRLDDFK